MNDRSIASTPAKVGYSTRLGARMDRAFARAMRQTGGSGSDATAIPVGLVTGSFHSQSAEAPMRFERLRRSRFFGMIKLPLLHLRNFVTAPVLSRVDALQGVLATHQRLIAQTLEAQKQVEALSRRAALSIERIDAALHSKSDEAAIRLDKLRQSTGFLHQKADDAVIKQRAVVHLKDAYAVPLRDGYLFIPEEDEGILLMYTAASPDGLEPGTRRIIQMIAPPGGTAIDVGASVGLHTLALGRAIGAAGRIYAFEAEPRLERPLRRTLAANGFNQVDLQILAVGAEHGEATFHVARTIGHSSLYALGGPDAVREEVRVQLRTLDELIPPQTMVDVIKIDVEGAELDVIKGAYATITRSRDCAIVAELGPSHLERVGLSLDDWIGAFTQFGLEGYAIAEPFGTVTPIDRDWLARQHSVNVLFVRPGSFAANALATHDVVRHA